MKIAVCDDKQIFLDSTVELLKSFKTVKHCDTFSNIEELLNQIETSDVANYSYDVILMDIQWNGFEKNGIQYAAALNKFLPYTQIIFMTAYNDQYSQAIFFEQLNLCGYLVKPIQISNLKVLLAKAERNLEIAKKAANDILLIQYNGTTEKILQNDILYLESKAHQVLVHTTQTVLTTYGKLNDYAVNLRSSFVAIHKSYVVNMDVVRKLEKQTITLNNDVTLPISKSQVQNVREVYLRYMQSQL